MVDLTSEEDGKSALEGEQQFDSMRESMSLKAVIGGSVGRSPSIFYGADIFKDNAFLDRLVAMALHVAYTINRHEDCHSAPHNMQPRSKRPKRRRHDHSSMRHITCNYCIGVRLVHKCKSHGEIFWSNGRKYRLWTL